MLSELRLPIAAGVMLASLVLMLHASDVLAGQNKRKTHPSPYAPYYYSRWNPHSLYSVYDHLSGGRQLCYLATEPCDNNHRMQN